MQPRLPGHDAVVTKLAQFLKKRRYDAASRDTSFTISFRDIVTLLIATIEVMPSSAWRCRFMRIICFRLLVD